MTSKESLASHPRQFLSAKSSGMPSVHSGVARRAEAERTRRNPRAAWSSTTIDAARLCASQGMTRVAAAKHLNMPYGSMYTLSRKHGIAFRDHPSAMGLPKAMRRAAKKEKARQGMAKVFDLATHYRALASSLRW